jgi:N utilization substance protein A
MVVSELRGEKIDIIPYNDEPARFVAKALSPARVREVLVDDDNRQATVVVPDDQLSLAIGREGQNARLAARLTGWRVDIKSETEFSQEEAEHGYEDDATQGRCAAILSSGRRCPNAALPASRYCGLPAHQSLEGTGTDHVGGAPPAAEEAAVAVAIEAPPAAAAEAGEQLAAATDEVPIDEHGHPVVTELADDPGPLHATDLGESEPAEAEEGGTVTAAPEEIVADGGEPAESPDREGASS